MYIAMVYTMHGRQEERFYCNEEQLEFVYENFNSYQDIKDNFNVKNTKRK